MNNINDKVLINSNDCEMVWSAARGNRIPTGAIKGGKESNGEIYYIGRAEYGNSLIIGKVHPAHQTLYLPFNGREVGVNVYEVLCIRK